MTTTLEAIQSRVLWLAVRMIHEANVIRPSADGLKVGGHQASSASCVSLLTALYLRWLRADDLVSVKPHASPVYHSLRYLMGDLDARYLTMLRQFGGLQSYPSRTKDPDRIDFSTGSVGLGAVAPLFAALADEYLRAHVTEAAGRWPDRRFVALVGDAELDEGNVWEAVLEDPLQGLGNVSLLVDLNRQSLDRVVPGIRIRRLEAMFSAAGWHVLETKYGSHLEAAFRAKDGAALRRRIDEMPNEEYQGLIRRPGAEARERLLAGAAADYRDKLARTLRDVSDADLPTLAGRPGRPRRGWHRARPGCRRRGARPAQRHLRLHHQGLAAALRRRPAQSLGDADLRAGGGAGREAGRERRRPLGSVQPRFLRGPAAGRTRRAAARRSGGSAGAAVGQAQAGQGFGVGGQGVGIGGRRACSDGRSRRARHPHPTACLHPTGAGRCAGGPGARAAAGRPHRDRLAGRLGLHQPGWLDQPGRRLLGGRGARPRRCSTAAALGAITQGSAHRAGHQRDGPLHVAEPGGPDGRAAGRDAGAHRHGL